MDALDGKLDGFNLKVYIYIYYPLVPLNGNRILLEPVMIIVASTVKYSRNIFLFLNCPSSHNRSQ